MKILIPYVGILAVGIGYFLANLALLPCVIVYHYRYLGYKMSKQSMYLILKTLPFISIGFLIANQQALDFRSVIGSIAIGIFMVLFLPSKNDFREVILILKNLRR